MEDLCIVADLVFQLGSGKVEDRNDATTSTAPQICVCNCQAMHQATECSSSSQLLIPVTVVAVRDTHTTQQFVLRSLLSRQSCFKPYLPVFASHSCSPVLPAVIKLPEYGRMALTLTACWLLNSCTEAQLRPPGLGWSDSCSLRVIAVLTFMSTYTRFRKSIISSTFQTSRLLLCVMLPCPSTRGTIQAVRLPLEEALLVTFGAVRAPSKPNIRFCDRSLSLGFREQDRHRVAC